MKMILILLLFMVPCYVSGPRPAEAADLYTVIHDDVMNQTGNAQLADWMPQAILYAASVYNVDPILICALIKEETRYQIGAVSSAGAIGPMQLMPDTAASLGVDPYNPLENILGGTSYIATELNKYASCGDYAATYAIAAYGCGSAAVDRYGGVPPYPEIQHAIQVISQFYGELATATQY